MQRWTSQPLPVPAFPEAPWERADLEFEDLLHDGPSYAVVLFLNNADVAEDAIPDQTPGYAGHFTVFAHGDCWGDPGHCDLQLRRPDAVQGAERKPQLVAGGATQLPAEAVRGDGGEGGEGPARARDHRGAYP